MIGLVNETEYCIPLTSPKDVFKMKKIQIDLVIHNNDTLVEVKKSKSLMQKRLTWCRNYVEVITNRAQRIYDLVVNTPDKNKNITNANVNIKMWVWGRR